MRTKRDALDSSRCDQSEFEALVSKLPWSSPIFLPTDAIDPAAKVEGMRRVVDIHTRQLDSVHRPRLRALRKAFKGRRRAFVIGNGPSLNRTDLSQLADEVVFCTNGFYLKFPDLDWRPTFHVVEDHLVAEDRAADINALTGITKLYPSYLAYCLDPGPDTIFFNHRGRLSFPHGFDFSIDASRVTYTGCTVTFTCLQLAFFMGFREIFLIGVDADYTIPEDAKPSNDYGTAVLDMRSDDPNHFHPDYFGKGKRWHDPQVDKMLAAYEEARQVTEAHGQKIYNATVGGKLEVFERRPFESLFPDSRTPNAETFKTSDQSKPPEARLPTFRSRYPRLAVIDMTPVGGETATGALKRALLANWPVERCLHVSANGNAEFTFLGGPVPPHEPAARFKSRKDALRLLQAYNPDVVLYRPLPEKPHLHELFLQFEAMQRSPFAFWIMDDWLARLEAQNHSAHAKWLIELGHLAQRAGKAFAISDQLRSALEIRLGTKFEVFANGADPEEWPAPEPKTANPLLIRYAGGLAEDMTCQSVVDLAGAVDRLCKKLPVQLDIRTGPTWREAARVRLAGLQSVSISTADLPRKDYVSWLQGADIVVLAYNFDHASLRYVRHSMANKLPELLVSGRPVLAIGPPEQATLRYMESAGLGWRIHRSGPESIAEGLLPLLKDASLRQRLGQEGRDHALRDLNLVDRRAKFEESLRSLAETRKSSSAPAPDKELLRLTRKGQERMNTQTILARRPMIARLMRIVRYYTGWRGMVGVAVIAASAWPALVSSEGGSSVSAVLGILLSMSCAVFVLFLIGHVFVVMQEQLNELEARFSTRKDT